MEQILSGATATPSAAPATAAPAPATPATPAAPTGDNPYAAILAGAAPVPKHEGGIRGFIHDVAAPLQPLIHSPAARALGTGVGKVFDVLNRPSEATLATLQRGIGGQHGGWNTLVHSETPEQYASDTAEMTRRMMQASPAEYQALPGWHRFLSEFATQLLLDPTTYLGGFGVLEHLGAVGGEKALPAFYRALQGAMASNVPIVKMAAHTVAKTHDMFTIAGETMRKVVPNLPGVSGLQRMAGQRLILNALRMSNVDLTEEIEHDLGQIYSSKIGGGTTMFGRERKITPKQQAAREQEQQMTEAIEKGTTGQLTGDAAQKAARFKELTDSLAYIQGDAGLRAALESGELNNGVKFVLPDRWKRFAFEQGADGAPDMSKPIIRNMMNRDQYLKEYVPRMTDISRFSQVAREQAEGDAPGIFGMAPKLYDTPQERAFQAAQERMAKAEPPIPRAAPKAQPFMYDPKDPRGVSEQYQAWERAQAAPRAGPEIPNEPIGPSLEETMRPSDAEKAPTYQPLGRDYEVKERTGGAPTHTYDPEVQRQIVGAYGRRFAASITAHDAEMKMMQLWGKGKWSQIPPEARDFFRVTLQEPTGLEFWKQVIDVPKVGLFALPFRHMMNIGSLAFLADPDPRNVFGTAKRFYQLMLANLPEESRERIFRYIGAPTGEVHAARAKVLGPAYKYGISGVPQRDRQAAGWIGQIPLIGNLYKASNHTLWSFDDAAKASRFQRLLDKYKAIEGKGLSKEELARPAPDGSGLTVGQVIESRAAARASDQVGAELIDYSNKSPFTNALANIAPFATYRSKMPRAVGRAVAYHPERVLAAGRAEPELVGDVQPGPPNPLTGAAQVGKSYLPMPEVLRGVNYPAEYARASMGYPAAMALAAGQNAVSAAQGEEPNPYFTYSKTVDPLDYAKYALNATVGSFPGGEFLLNRIPGAGIWGTAAPGTAAAQQYPGQLPVPTTDISGMLRQQTGFGLTHAPSANQLRDQATHDYYVNTIREIEARGGDATAVRHKFHSWLMYHRLWVP